MEFDLYKQEFTKLAFTAGYTEQYVDKCLKYAEVLFKNNVPVIYNTANLAALVGYTKGYLKKSVTYTNSYYRFFEIKKKNGTTRGIAEPLPSLKEIQLWILQNILYKVEVSPFAKAYIPKVGIIDNLKFHRKQPKVLSLDIRNFFGSISQSSVEAIFISLGYSKILSNLLAKLCCLNDILPQGAPTSPYLSNIYFKKADDAISAYCLERKIRYTRYADDLTFSGDFNDVELFNLIQNIVEDLRLSINPDKTKLMMPNQRQSVTGIIVNQKIQVVFHKRNKLRQELYYIKKNGLLDHMRFKKIKKANYLEHLIGQINFILYLNPEDLEFQEYKKVLYNIKNTNIQ